jgi:Holliday junction resolvase-like predicted endonuclease
MSRIVPSADEWLTGSGTERREMEMGESIVASYLRYVAGCELVLHNTFTGEGQGEIDVIGLIPTKREVIFCEVATHICGLQYGTGEETVERIKRKFERAATFGQKMFGSDVRRYEFWSPAVRAGLLDGLTRVAREAPEPFELVVNSAYEKRVRALIEKAAKNTSATSDPAFRLLQILNCAGVIAS